MVIGLGLDLVEIDRARASYSRWGSRLIDKLMDPPEAARLRDLSAEPVVAIAHSIALKEAGSKAIGTGWSRGVRWRDVIVETRPSLHVRFAHRAAEVAERLGASGRTRAAIEVRDGLVLGEVHLLGGPS
jgi:holo-[acyl-carrier protein] synthase